MTDGQSHQAAPDTVGDRGSGDQRPGPSCWSLSSLADPGGLAIAALVLAGISLFDIGAGHEIASAFAQSGRSSVHSLAIVDGIQAGVAAIAVGLGLYVVRSQWAAPEVGWADWLSRAAIVVGGLAFVVDIAGLIFALVLNVHLPQPAIAPVPLPTPTPVP